MCPSQLSPVTISSQSSTIIELSGIPQAVPTTITPASNTLRTPTIKEYIQALHPALFMALGDLAFPTHVAIFQQALLEGKVVMASDGYLQGSNDATQGWNKALISRVQKWWHSESSKTLAPDYDLLQAAMQISKKHNIMIIPHHVKSHQDLEIAYNKLSWEAKLNCDRDSLANQARTYTRCKSDATKKYIPPVHRATLFVQGQWITGHVSRAIREASYRGSLEQLICARNGWDTKRIFEMVDWPARHRAGARITGILQRMTLFKLEFDLLAKIETTEEVCAACPASNCGSVSIALK